MCYSGCKYEDYFGDCKLKECRAEIDIEKHEIAKDMNNIIQKLILNKADGLCNDDCGCGIDDLMPCGEIDNLRSCKPAKKYIKNNKCKICFYYNDCKGYCYKPIRKRRKI